MSRLFGGILLATGLLVMTVSGLCSLTVIIAGFEEFMKDPMVILLPGFVGGVPFLIGFGLFQWGRRILRRDREGY